jgi:zinc transport system ATP-binding protein
MPLKTIIEAKKLTYVRDGELIIDKFDFRVTRGQLVGIIGPNGGGKSTLVRLIAGLIRPTSGTVRIFGMDPAERAARRLLSYVPQRGGNIDAQFPATVEEIVRSGTVGRKTCDHAAEEAMDIMDVTHLRNRTLGFLSGGERQRALIARALASRPELLILDEPTDGLDPDARASLYATLRQLREERRMTVLLVSHDVHAVAHEADAALCLRHELVCHGHKVCMLRGEKIRNAFHSERAELAEHHAEAHDARTL